MKLRNKKIKLLLVMILLISPLLWISCKTTPNINDELIKITLPNPIVDGESLIKLENDKIIMEPSYYYELMEYIIKTEEYKKLLKDGE